MKTLGEIITICRDGGTPTVDEMRYAICAMDGLSSLDQSDITLNASKELENKRCPTWSRVHELVFDRWKRALARTPKQWIGDSDPDCPKYQEQRQRSKKFVEAALRGAD